MQGLMRMLIAVIPALTLAGATGCTSRVTNLTPSALPRESSGLYHFEAEWKSTQRSLNLRAGDIHGYVVVGEKFHPLERVPLMTNRWEADVPLPAGKNPVFYRFKWDYGTAGFGRVNTNSTRSREYRLELLDGPAQ